MMEFCKAYPGIRKYSIATRYAHTPYSIETVNMTACCQNISLPSVAVMIETLWNVQSSLHQNKTASGMKPKQDPKEEHTNKVMSQQFLKMVYVYDLGSCRLCW